MFYSTHDNFYANAVKLRSEFEKNFARPKSMSAKRFVWDYWHVPDQYTLMRTPAWEYFSKAQYAQFHKALLQFGREVLGCYDVTPPWLSYYIDGCGQELHADVPHGPWAFVYSLSPWFPAVGKSKGARTGTTTDHRPFSGGETWILNPETLEYWQNFSNLKGVELNDLTTRIPAYFNRLTIFDPRLPHGVREVRGPKDPINARLVIHGWFKDPEPYVTGGLSRDKATQGANEILERMAPLFDEFEDCHGTLSLRFKVARNGRVSQLRWMTSTVRSLIPATNGSAKASSRVRTLQKKIAAAVVKQKFAPAARESFVTLPLLFRF